MTEPKRIQLSREKGSRLPTNAVKVDRTTEFGNPYCIAAPMNMKMVRRWGWNISPAGQKYECRDAEDAVQRFAHALFWDSAIHDHLRQKLAGKDLACWCEAGQPCHADTLLVIANSTPAEVAEMQALADARIMDAATSVLHS
jgi:hypothetical protein